MGPPTNNTCRLYTGNVGGGNPPQALLYVDAPANSTTGDSGFTIFLKSSKPKQINGGSK